ncbi:MAG: methylenetetrahydrofolate--tRNA-(uracil(54)-C(5))-methyltransferase (FADH(2)-oxidizing) TrmFO, partial [Clostridia bacterium]
PNTTIIGQLQNHISMPCCDFQPMNANFGILPQLCNPSRDKKARKLQYSERGLQDMQDYLDKRS